MIKKIAYKIVFKELSKYGMLVGKYDAKHSTEDFMYGISTVMEKIAYSIDDKTGQAFEDKFIKNMIESEKNT